MDLPSYAQEFPAALRCRARLLEEQRGCSHSTTWHGLCVYRDDQAQCHQPFAAAAVAAVLSAGPGAAKRIAEMRREGLQPEQIAAQMPLTTQQVCLFLSVYLPAEAKPDGEIDQ